MSMEIALHEHGDSIVGVAFGVRLTNAWFTAPLLFYVSRGSCKAR